MRTGGGGGRGEGGVMRGEEEEGGGRISPVEDGDGVHVTERSGGEGGALGEQRANRAIHQLRGRLRQGCGKWLKVVRGVLVECCGCVFRCLVWLDMRVRQVR